MTEFIGHGLLTEYSCKIELRQEDSLKEVLNRLMMPEKLQEEIIFIKQHKKIEYNSMINDGDKIDMFAVLLGG